MSAVVVRAVVGILISFSLFVLAEGSVLELVLALRLSHSGGGTGV